MSAGDALADSMKPLVVTGVQIADAGVEIAFFETREQTDKAAIMKSLMFTRDLFPREVEELLEVLEDLVDKGLVAVRNPATQLTPRERIMSGAPVAAPED